EIMHERCEWVKAAQRRDPRVGGDLEGVLDAVDEQMRKMADDVLALLDPRPRQAPRELQELADARELAHDRVVARDDDLGVRECRADASERERHARLHREA